MCGGEEEHAQLWRVLEDQTTNGRLKPGKEIKPTSMQNPSDEDATYRKKGGKGHQGYTLNIVEDCGEGANIITKYDYDANVKSDAEFADEMVDKMGKQEEKTVVLSDGSYVSDEMLKKSAEMNIEWIPSAMTGAMPNPIVSEFEIGDNCINKCPEGQEPTSSEYDDKKEEYKAKFDRGKCDICPRREECPAKNHNKKTTVKLTKKTIKRAEMSIRMGEEHYKESARKRNGVEGVPSVLRRRYGVDEMPVRGLLRTKMWVGFKVGAINAKRVIAALLSQAFFAVFSAAFQIRLPISLSPLHFPRFRFPFPHAI
jgi:hypothetical protein